MNKMNTNKVQKSNVGEKYEAIQKKMAFTIASDPEVHIFDTKKKRIVSSINVLKNDKYNPFDLGDGIKAYSDSVLTEVSLPPAKTKTEFINNFRESFLRLQKKLGNRYKLVPKSAHDYDKSELKDKAAWLVGCNATYNCYERKMCQPDGFKDNFRTSSAHLHLGSEKLKEFRNRELAVKILDLFVGCASVIFDKDPTSSKRRTYYGECGNFRMPEHGLEWRVLGGNVLSNPDMIDLVYDLTDYALSFIETDTAEKILSLVDEKDVIKAVNDCDDKLAEKLLIKAGLPKELFKRVKSKYSYDLYKNWGLEVKA